MALTGVMVFSFMGCNMIERTPAAINKTVVAKVGDTKITKGDIDESLKGLLESAKERYGENYEENEEAKELLLQYRQSQLNNLVMQKLLLQYAEKNNLVPSDEELTKKAEEKINLIKEQYETEEKYNEALEAAGYTADEFLKLQKESVIMDIAQQHITEEVDKSISVSDDEIKTYYDENKGAFNRKPGADTFNIVLDSEEKANEVREQIKSLDDFKKFADEYNTDSTKGKGGYLGYTTYEDNGLIPEFNDALKNLKSGELSQPVKTDYGWHLIWVENASDEAHEATLDEAKIEIASKILDNKKNTAYNEKLEELKKEYNVKTYEDKL